MKITSVVFFYFKRLGQHVYFHLEPKLFVKLVFIFIFIFNILTRNKESIRFEKRESSLNRPPQYLVQLNVLS